jgi:predicted DNA-binding ribbon-helix-helix protein
MKLAELVTSINSDRRRGNLSSAIRLFVLNHALNDEARRTAPDRNHGTSARGEAQRARRVRNLTRRSTTPTRQF